MAFLIAFGAILALALVQGDKRFYFDSGYYWLLSGTFTHDGEFSLLNFADPLRGYAYPLLLFMLDGLGEVGNLGNPVVVKTLNSMAFALIGCVLVPKLAELTWPGRRWGLWRRLLLTCLLIVFWRGYLDYPLTDFPALVLALTAVVAASRSNSPTWLAVAGIAAAAAVNFRPAYLLVPLTVMALVALAWWDERDRAHPPWSRRALCATAMIVGFLASIHR